jgi:hypothetical protein
MRLLAAGRGRSSRSGQSIVAAAIPLPASQIAAAAGAAKKM